LEKNPAAIARGSLQSTLNIAHDPSSPVGKR
jgi:hypothetical protein